MSARDGSEEHFCKFLKVDWRQGLEAVGRKDLPRAALVLGRGAGEDSGRGNAASASHPAAVRFPPALHEAPRRLLPGARPSGFPPSSPCGPGPPYGPRAHSEFPPGDALAPAADEHSVGCEAAP